MSNQSHEKYKIEAEKKDDRRMRGHGNESTSPHLSDFA